MTGLEQRNLLLHIAGGIGKCIMATAVVRNWKLKHPKSSVVIVSGYPEVFLNNPDVYRSYSFNTPYLWQDYYSKEEYFVYAHDPYFTEDWIKDKPKHLVDVWSEQLGVEATQKKPLLYFSHPEMEGIKSMIQVDMPIAIVQSTGGPNPGANDWLRNPPSEELGDYLGKYVDTHFIVHLCLPNTPEIRNVHQRVESLSIRQAMCLINYAHTFIGIDSFGVHARAAGKNLENTHIFYPLSSSVARLGYEEFENFIPVDEVNSAILNHADYFSNLFKNTISNPPENCPVEPGTKWFDIK